MHSTRIPKHVAIIMDGNGRWGEQRGKRRSHGHRAGAKRVREIVECAHQAEVSVLSLWGFSTDNWNRPRYEVDVLLSLFESYFSSQAQELHAANVRVTFIGVRKDLPQQLQNVMKDLETLTAQNTGLHLQLAINYGGRDEIVRAARILAIQALQRQLDPYAITHADFEPLLDTAGVLDPDLVIRTGGEFRTSGFMPYQTTSAEWYFSDCLWPDFTQAEFEIALTTYGKRERRFGGIPAAKIAI